MNATDTPLKAECPPLGTKLGLAACTYGFKSTLALLARFRDWKEYFYPPEGGPDLVKRYEVRPHLPIRYTSSLRLSPANFLLFPL